MAVSRGQHPHLHVDSTAHHRPDRASSDAASLSSPSPSLKASSLKVRDALAVAHLLGSRGRPAFPAQPAPRLADLTRPDDCPPPQTLSKSPPSDKMAHPPKNSTSPLRPSLPTQSPTAMAPTTVQQQQPMTQQSNSKPRTIIRMLTTKFSARSSSPSSHPRRNVLPPSAPNVYSAEARAAALRERGLLPPLPARDLSAQEMAQDMRIPIVSGGDGHGRGSGSGDGGALSAADLIKREWEAKNSDLVALVHLESGGSGVDGNGDAHPDAPAPATASVDETTPTQAPDADALNRSRMREFRFGGPGSAPPSPNPALGSSQHQLLHHHQEEEEGADAEGVLVEGLVGAVADTDECAGADKEHRSTGGSADMPRPLPALPSDPAQSSSPSPALSSTSSPPPITLSPPTPAKTLPFLRRLSPSTPTAAASTTPLSPPPTDALPPTPSSPTLTAPVQRSPSLRPLPSPPTSPASSARQTQPRSPSPGTRQRQIHPDLQGFMFPPLPPSPSPVETPSFVLSLPSPGGIPSTSASGAGVREKEMDVDVKDVEPWASALPPIPPSPALSTRSALSVRSTRSVRSATNGRNAMPSPGPMPSSPPPAVPTSPTFAKAQATPPEISLTPPERSVLGDAMGLGVSGGDHVRNDSFTLLEAGVSRISGLEVGGGVEERERESGAKENASVSDGLRGQETANADRDLSSACASVSASAPERTAAPPSSASSPSSAPAADANAPDAPGPTPPIPKGKRGALTVKVQTPAPVVVVESPLPTGGSVGGRWAEALGVVVEEGEESGNVGSGISVNRSRAGSVTPTPSLGMGRTLTSSATATATKATPSTGANTSPRTSQDSASDAQYVYARPAGAAAPVLVASPLSSLHSHSHSHSSSLGSSASGHASSSAMSHSSSFAAAAAALSSASAPNINGNGNGSSVPPTPATAAARIPLPPTPTSPTASVPPPAIRVSSAFANSNGSAGKRAQKRGMTDPNGTEKRKILNPFKRSASAVATRSGERVPNANGDAVGPTRRLSVAASFLRRSVVGTISSGSNANGATIRTPRTFNAAHLPPSPTLPTTVMRQPTVRQAVAPPVYSRGSIQQQTSAIEDEETRRMTELAFLG